jgi:hypothetical protein
MAEPVHGMLSSADVELDGPGSPKVRAIVISVDAPATASLTA